MRSSPDATARDARKAAETLPELPAVDAAIAALDLSPPLALAQRAPMSPRAPVSPLAIMTPAVVPVIESSARPSRSPESFGPSSFGRDVGRDIVREERAAKRKTTLLVASLWAVAFALVGALLFMINR